MTRAGALAALAAKCMANGSLIMYEPGEMMVVDHRLCGAERVAPREAPEHVFEAQDGKWEVGGMMCPAVGYHADPNA